MNKSIPLLLALPLLLFSCQSRKDQVNKVVEQNLQESEFNGYLYLEQQNEVLYDQSIQSTAQPLPTITDSSKLYLASLTKLFTQVALIRLHEQQRIDWSAPIVDYRPDFHPDFGRRVTVGDLFKMTSGLPREVFPDSMSFVTLDEQGLAGPYLDTLPDYELAFEPGTREEYSNLNYWLLGGIIENITRQNLHEAFDQLVFAPLGMNNSGLLPSKRSVVKGFIYEEDLWQIDPTDYQGRYASGGCYSTVKDLKTLSKALKGQDFLTPKSKKRLLGSSERIELYGSLPGNSNMYVQDLKEAYTLIALNNLGLIDLAAMTKLKNGLEEALGITTPKRPRKVVKLSPMDHLKDSHEVESALLVWAKTVETGSPEKIFEGIDQASVPGSMNEADPTWAELSRLNKTLPQFRALGYRWVEDQKPEGLEVWFGSDEEGKLAIRWLLSKTDTTQVENLFVMPDDMIWLGKSY